MHPGHGNIDEGGGADIRLQVQIPEGEKVGELTAHPVGRAIKDWTIFLLEASFDKFVDRFPPTTSC